MSATGIKVVDYVQSAPSATWTIVHNLGRHPVSDVAVVDSGNHKILPLSVTHTNDNTVVVEFSTPFAGTARLV